ncbi:MAG: LysO family transporter, partial [Ruminiclostridium sp.]|nr:LysO family transporter [Ruminiclostridium sp.]
QAGYPVASAISFLHNAIRETFGIIAIPFIAAKIGYIESTAVPGVAAWDVCMPIVEQHTNEDTVIYSFATGCMMFVTIPVVIPLVLTA